MGAPLDVVIVEAGLWFIVNRALRYGLVKERMEQTLRDLLEIRRGVNVKMLQHS